MSAAKGAGARLAASTRTPRARLRRRLLRLWQRGMGRGWGDTRRTQWMWRWICVLNLGHDLDGYMFEEYLHCAFCGRRVLNKDRRPVVDLPASPGADEPAVKAEGAPR